MTNKGLDMSIKDDQDRCRSLVCDPNGIIVAEMVYRCMICFYVSDTMTEARQHYVLKHMDEDLNNDDYVDNGDDLVDLRQSKKKTRNVNNNNNNLNNNNNVLDNYSPINGSNKYRNSPVEPIDMSPSSDSFDHYQQLVTIDGKNVI